MAIFGFQTGGFPIANAQPVPVFETAPKRFEDLFGLEN
jgi:hypothetical protein